MDAQSAYAHYVLECSRANSKKLEKLEGSAICVWCERKLQPAPTKLWWFKHTRAGYGLCYECALSVARNVLIALEHATTESGE